MMARGHFLQAHPLLCALFAIVGYAHPTFATLLTNDSLIVVGNLRRSSELVGGVLPPAAGHQLEAVIKGNVHVTSLRPMTEVQLPVFLAAPIADISEWHLFVSAPIAWRLKVDQSNNAFSCQIGHAC